MEWLSWTPPRWASLLIGLAAIVLGATLTFKPFSSLTALALLIGAALIVAGLGEFFDKQQPSRVVGGLLVLTGLAALVLPGTTVRTIATVVGAGAVLSGLARIWAGIRGSTDERYVALAGGAASVILGVLALSWPDITILAVALLVGPIAVIFGVGQILRAITGDRDRASETGIWARFRGWGRFVRASIALALAVLLIGLSSLLNRGDAEVDAFYDRPSELPNAAGTLIRDDRFDRNLPEGARARRILYTTTKYDGTITTASAIVYQPEGDASTPRSAVLWTHGTTGAARRCAPSLLRDPLAIGGMPDPAGAIAQGWVIIAPDYTGLGTEGPHPYLIGRPEAMAALDAVRAARQLEELTLNGQTVVWGHSQGGGAALWVGIEQATYAPDVPIAGVAALAPASDLQNLAAGMLQNATGLVFATYIIEAYTKVYPDVKFNDYVKPTAGKVVEQMIDRCVELKTIVSVGETMLGESVYSQELTQGALGMRLTENTPSAPSGLPTLIAQGETDDLVLPDVQRAFVDGLCQAGQVVDYRTYAGKDHVGVVGADSPLVSELMAWTTARFAGEAVPTECTTTTG